MNTINLTADGTLALKQEEMTQDPLLSLGYKLGLDRACTLRSYFRMLEKYPLFTRLSQFIPDAAAQYASCPCADCIHPDLDGIELGKTIEMVGFPGEPRIDCYITLQGIRKGETRDITSSGLAQILDMPLVLGKLKHVVFGDNIDTFEFDTIFSLFEFIEGISWALSFHHDATRCSIRPGIPG